MAEQKEQLRAGFYDKAAALELKDLFCNKIRSSSSGSDYLQSITDCSIEIVSSTGTLVSKSPLLTDASVLATLDWTIVLEGIDKGIATHNELDLVGLMNRAFISTYNDIHWENGLYLSGLETPLSISTLDTSANGNMMLISSSIMNVITDSICQNCQNRASESFSQLMDIEAMENAFCKKIRSIVSETKLEAINFCAILLR
jgi:hypothetical protein